MVIRFYSQHIHFPARGNAIMDLVLSREPEIVSHVKTINNLGNSDHNMILFSAHLCCNVYADVKGLRDCRLRDYVKIR